MILILSFSLKAQSQEIPICQMPTIVQEHFSMFINSQVVRDFE